MDLRKIIDFIMIFIFPVIFHFTLWIYITKNIVYAMANYRPVIFYTIQIILYLTYTAISFVYFKITERGWKQSLYGPAFLLIILSLWSYFARLS